MTLPNGGATGKGPRRPSDAWTDMPPIVALVWSHPFASPVLAIGNRARAILRNRVTFSWLDGSRREIARVEWTDNSGAPYEFERQGPRTSNPGGSTYV